MCVVAFWERIGEVFMRLSKIATSTLVLTSFCGLSVVNSVSASNGYENTAEGTKTDSLGAFEKANQYVTEHKGTISTIIVCLVLFVIYKILPEELKRNIVSLFRKERYITSTLTSGREQNSSGAFTPGQEFFETPGDKPLYGERLFNRPNEARSSEKKTNKKNSPQQLNICDLAKQEKYKESVLKAIYTCLFLANGEEGNISIINISFFVFDEKMKKGFGEVCLKFFKGLEKKKQLSKFSAEEKKIDIGGELGKYLINIESITLQGKKDIAKFVLDNLDNFSDINKRKLYNMYWHRWYPDNIVFDSFVKDLNFYVG